MLSKLDSGFLSCLSWLIPLSSPSEWSLCQYGILASVSKYHTLNRTLLRFIVLFKTNLPCLLLDMHLWYSLTRGVFIFSSFTFPWWKVFFNIWRCNYTVFNYSTPVSLYCIIFYVSQLYFFLWEKIYCLYAFCFISMSSVFFDISLVRLCLFIMFPNAVYTIYPPWACPSDIFFPLEKGGGFCFVLGYNYWTLIKSMISKKTLSSILDDGLGKTTSFSKLFYLPLQLCF